MTYDSGKSYVWPSSLTSENAHVEIALPAVVTLLLSAGAHAQPVAWTVDKNHSDIGFTASHLGFSKVHGQFKTFTATVEADAKTGKITKLEAEADSKSLDTGVGKRDNDLRSDTSSRPTSSRA